MKMDAEIVFLNDKVKLKGYSKLVTVDPDYVKNDDDLLWEIEDRLFHQYRVPLRYPYDYAIVNLPELRENASYEEDV